MIPQEMKNKGSWLQGNERLGQNRDSEYLGAEDIDDDVEPVLTISGLWYGAVTLQRGKENKDVIVFQEETVPGIRQVRPLIVNSTNRKVLRKLYGDAKASTLVGKKIQLYIDHNVRDPQNGGITDGIRIRAHKPRVQRTEPLPTCTDCGGEIRPAMGRSAEWLVNYTMKNYGGVPLCADCATKRKEAQADSTKQETPEQPGTEAEAEPETLEQDDEEAEAEANVI